MTERKSPKVVHTLNATLVHLHSNADHEFDNIPSLFISASRPVNGKAGNLHLLFTFYLTFSTI